MYMKQRSAARVGSSSLATRWPLLLSRAATSRAASLATRKQVFKEHLVELQNKDPDRWTTHALSHHFQQPLENTAAALALQQIEAEAGVLDEDLVLLAEDAEEYLESEDADDELPGARQQAQKKALPAATASGDTSAAPSVTLDSLGAADEQALVEALTTRLDHGDGGVAPGVGPAEALGAAVRAAIEQLDDEALHALQELIHEGNAPPPSDSGDARLSLLRALTSDVPSSLLEGGGGGAAVDLSALGLPPVSPELSAALSAAAAGNPAAASGSAADSAADGSADSVAEAEHFLSPRSLGQPEMHARPIPEENGIVFRRAKGAEAAEEVYEADFLEVLRANLEKRQRRLQWASEGVHYPFPNRGRMIFTDVTREKRNVPTAKRIWVSAKGEGIVEPTESEAATATTRAVPPRLRSRLKRNTLIRGTAVRW